MGSDDRTGADLSLKVAGQEVNVKNVKSLNTILTVFILLIVTVLAYGGWMHVVEAKDEAKTVSQVLKESNAQVAAALKESNAIVTDAIKQMAAEQRQMTQEIRRGHEFQRETACLLDPALKNRPDARDVCRRLGRVDR